MTKTEYKTLSSYNRAFCRTITRDTPDPLKTRIENCLKSGRGLLKSEKNRAIMDSVYPIRIDPLLDARRNRETTALFSKLGW